MSTDKTYNLPLAYSMKHEQELRQMIEERLTRCEKLMRELDAAIEALTAKIESHGRYEN
jgi:hypothetical protein